MKNVTIHNNKKVMGKGKAFGGFLCNNEENCKNIVYENVIKEK